jgi:hypothetical protein
LVCGALRITTVKMIAEYLEHAVQFESMAGEAADPILKETLLGQAKAYRKLADERAVRLKITLPPSPNNSTQRVP